MNPEMTVSGTSPRREKFFLSLLPKSPFDAPPSSTSDDRMTPPAPRFVDFFAGSGVKRTLEIGRFDIGVSVSGSVASAGNGQRMSRGACPGTSSGGPNFHSSDIQI